MNVLNIFWRNMKWRFQNPVTIVMTVIQPLIWLLLYSSVAGQTVIGKATGNYTAFILPGILVLVILASSGSSGFINYIMKAGGSFYRIRISPVWRSSIVLGHILEAILLSFIEVVILWILSLFMSVHVASGLVGMSLMTLLVFLTAFFVAGLSYSLSLCLPNEVVFETVMNTIVLPIFFLSTALFPLDEITGGLRIAVILNPFTHVINSLRSLVLESAIDWQGIFNVAALFVILGSLSLALAVWCLKKESEQ